MLFKKLFLKKVVQMKFWESSKTAFFDWVPLRNLAIFAKIVHFSHEWPRLDMFPCFIFNETCCIEQAHGSYSYGRFSSFLKNFWFFRKNQSSCKCSRGSFFVRSRIRKFLLIFLSFFSRFQNGFFQVFKISFEQLSLEKVS